MPLMETMLLPKTEVWKLLKLNGTPFRFWPCKRYYFQVRAKQLWTEKFFCVPSNLKKSSSKISVLNKKKPKTVLLPTQSKATLHRKSFFVFQAIWKKVVPKSKFWTRKSPKRCYFQLRKKTLVLKFKNATSSLGSLNLQTLPRSSAGPALICTDIITII